jgi:CheY-like chemotaxis protein
MEELLKRRPIKGIALSGFGMEEDVKKSKQAGFYEHLTKPINFKRLETAIKQLTSILERGMGVSPMDACTHAHQAQL